MTRLVIRHGTVLDQQGERRADVAIADGRIVGVGTDLPAEDDDRVLDAAGSHVTPGFVDLHVHLREPGREEAETIETGSRAAALGGFTAVVAMPNTEPPQDSLPTIEFVRAQARRAGLCHVAPAGCITLGRAGEQLAPLGELAAAGVHLFTDDGNGVQDPGLMRRALEYARPLGITLAQHCEVASLTRGAVMHEGSCCSHLGLPGWPAIAEELMVHRDIELSRLTGAPVHFLHLSTARSVALVRAAKAEGLPVTAEATPHHFTLTDESLRTYDATFKVNPPLRTSADIAAIKDGLADGTIDAIATDHAPHLPEGREAPRSGAPWHARPADRCRLRHRASTCRSPTWWLRYLVPARSPRSTTCHGRPVAAGEAVSRRTSPGRRHRRRRRLPIDDIAAIQAADQHIHAASTAEGAIQASPTQHHE
ncbi:MAG: dihydroorotase [Ilumatobacteraceae bacterium]